MFNKYCCSNCRKDIFDYPQGCANCPCHTPQEPEQKCCKRCNRWFAEPGHCISKNCPCHSPKEAPKECICTHNVNISPHQNSCPLAKVFSSGLSAKQEEVKLWDGHKFAAGKDMKEALSKLNHEQEEVKECECPFNDGTMGKCSKTCKCSCNKVTPEKSWERFERLVYEEVEEWCNKEGYAGGYGKMKADEILEGAKELLRTELASQRELIKSKIKELKRENPEFSRLPAYVKKYSQEYGSAYNKALEDLTNLLDKI